MKRQYRKRIILSILLACLVIFLMYVWKTVSTSIKLPLVGVVVGLFYTVVDWLVLIISGKDIRDWVKELKGRRRKEQSVRAGILKPFFRQAEDAFEVEIKNNFLFEFNGPNTDYLQLLSKDFENEFFKRFNESNHTNKYNRICITGREVVGKTFNSLLIGKKLKQEGYIVYYTEDIQDASFSEKIFLEIMDSFKEHSVFIIDDCQSDKTKMEEIVKKITHAGGYAKKPRFIFLTRPLDLIDIEDIFGKNTPIIKFEERYVNFEYLAGLFFRNIIKRPHELSVFLASVEKNDFSKIFLKSKYRDMVYWNNYFRFMERNRKVKIEKTKFELPYEFFTGNEAYLMEDKKILEKLLPFFMNRISIHRDYVRDKLQISDVEIQKLEKNKIIHLRCHDWTNKAWEKDRATFIVSRIHPTNAKIMANLLKRYKSLELDICSAIADYVETYYENMYYIIPPFYESATLEELSNNDKFVSILKKYFEERHLGKRLDRIIRTFSKLEPQLKDKLIDDEIITSFVKKLNDKKPYMVNKLYLFRAMSKYSSLRTYELFEKFDTKVFIDDFNNNPEGTGIHSFAKFMEIFKNIYYSVGILTKRQVEKAGLDWRDVSEKLTKNGWAKVINSEEVLLIIADLDQETIDHILKIFGDDDFSKIRPILQQALVDKVAEPKLRIVNIVKEILDGCSEEFVRRFEKRDNFFTQFHLLLKRLDGMKLGNYILEKIPPPRIIEWIKSKDTNTVELSKYLLKDALHTKYSESVGDRRSYFDYFKNSLDYSDIKKIFDNKRSGLYDLVINANYEILANYLYRYSSENIFMEKVSKESTYLINKSIGLLENNIYLSDEQKKFIIGKIKNISFKKE